MNKKNTSDELDVFPRKHKLWLVDDPDGQEADLFGANLRGADLRGANLFGTDLRGANLQWADLRDTDLRKADLRGAKNINYPICGADLCG